MNRRVLITGTGGTGVGASVLHALRLPDARDRWDLVAVDASPFSWGLYTADRSALVPGAGDPAYLECVTKLVAEHEVSAVIPGTEAETALLADHRDDVGVPVIANRASLMPLMRDKRHGQQELARMGLPHVPSYPWEQRELALNEFGFPLVVKPARESSGSRGLHLVTSRAELDALVPFLRADSDVQPYLGDADHEYAIATLTDPKGRIIDSFALRRELTGFSLHTEADFAGERVAVSTGFSQGYIVRDEQIQGWAEYLALRLKSRGPLNFQLRMHHDEPHVFEIHPRFTFSAAFRASAGFNEADVLLRCALDNERFTRLHYCTDRAVIRAFDHILVPVERMLG